MLLICCGYPNYNAQGAFVIIFFICSDLYNCLRSLCTVLVKLVALLKRNCLYETFSSNFLRNHSFKVLWVASWDRLYNKATLSKFKGYLRYKTILCYKVTLDMQLMNFFIWRKNNVLFSRYRDFCVFVKPTNFKICDVIINIAR